MDNTELPEEGEQTRYSKGALAGTAAVAAAAGIGGTAAFVALRGRKADKADENAGEEDKKSSSKASANATCGWL